MKDTFSHIRHWVFDLDNTLYPPEMRLFDQIEKRMTSYVMNSLNVTADQAQDLRVSYWKTYGTTLAGLMANHNLDPVPFLEDVHDISFDVLSPDAELRAQIEALPGRKIIYTNGTRPYAERVIEARGLDGLFEAIYGVEHAGYAPKPERSAFEKVFALDGTDTTTAAMFEDDIRNLQVPHAMGMKTVLVAEEPTDHDHIHHHTNDLAAFLSKLV